MIRQSYTAIIERNQTWSGQFSTEPYEVAWAGEALFFIRSLDLSGIAAGTSIEAKVEISPDGMHWCEEGTTVILPDERDKITYCRVRHFGGWLRLAGELAAGATITVIVYLSLKA